MGDVAQILGRTAAGVNSLSELPPVVPTFTSAPPDAKKYAKKGAANEAANPSNTDPLSSAVKQVKVGNKLISSAKRARKWAWAPFTSSSRTDGAEFSHWVRAGVDYVEYPFARFDIHMDPVTYTQEEYRRYLQSDTWTFSETSYLMELAKTYELRWPVISDRWYDKFYYSNDTYPNNDNSGASTRRIEDLQHRYYEVAAKLAQVRISQEAAKEVQQLQTATSAAAASAAAAAAAAASSTNMPAQSGPPGSGPGGSALSGPGPGSGSGGSSTALTHAPKSAPVPKPSSIDPTVVLPAGVDEMTEGLLLETAAARAMATNPGSQPLMNFLGTGSTNKMFDLAHERKRRHHLDRLWKRSKEDEEEETELRKELREVEAQLRKLKKSGGHILAAAGIGGSTNASTNSAAGAAAAVGAVNQAPSAASSRNASRSVSPMMGLTSSSSSFVGSNFKSVDGDDDGASDVFDKGFASTAPVPVPGHPYLQSGRLVPPAAGGEVGINKNLLTRMDQVLTELNVKDKPLPTKRVCDMYDNVRKDILTLVTLQKDVLQKEGQLQAKQIQLAKMTNTIQAATPTVGSSSGGGAESKPMLDEEGLLGIPPPAPAPAPAPPKSQKSKVTKKKTSAASGGSSSGGGGGGGKKGIKKAPDITDNTSASRTGDTKKKVTKRKRKSEAKSPAPPSGGATSTSTKAGATKKSSGNTAQVVGAADPLALAAQAAAAGATVGATQAAADIAVSAAGATAPKKRSRKS